MRLLAVVLKKKYHKESSVHIPQHRYIIKKKIKDEPSKILASTKVLREGRNTVLSKNRTTKEKIPKFL